MPLIETSEFPNPAPAERAAAKDLICEILAAAGGTLRYATRLHKVFYLAHVYFFENEGYFLSAYPIVQMPNGPGIHDYRSLFNELEAEGRITINEDRSWGHKEFTYRTNEPFPVDNAPRQDAIRRAVDKVNGMMPTELSKWAHDFSRSWRQAEPGHSLNVAIDLLEDEDYEDLMEGGRQAKQQALEILGAAANP